MSKVIRLPFIGGYPVIAATLDAKPANAPGHDLFGTFEFGVSSERLPLSGAIIRYGITAAEILIRITDGTSVRSSWFSDQAVEQPTAAQITRTENSEAVATKTSDSGLSSSVGLNDVSAALKLGTVNTKTSKTVATTQLQYSASIANVRAVGSSREPAWHITPPLHETYVRGFLPNDGRRLMRVLADRPDKEVLIEAEARAVYGRVSIDGSRLSGPNVEVIAAVLFRKHRRNRGKSAILSSIRIVDRALPQHADF
jgi:hypothetical protein